MKAKNLCIIPARGGSKRIPRKNIRPFKGKPIIAYSILAAIETGVFDEVMVSTDDLQIEEIAKFYGASVPFLRSATNSDDFATTADVLMEVLDSYKKVGREFEAICCIYPTAPFVSSKRLIEGYNMLLKGADSVLPISTFDYPIWRSFKRNERESLEYVWSEYKNSRSQDLPTVYHDAGQWYWLNCYKFSMSGRMILETTKGLHLSPFEAHDIDSIEDWILAELKYEYLQSIK